MIIKKLRLKGYMRIMLGGIDDITIEPESLYQCILGTNGSGKSSLMSEWSLLPGNAGDFIKGGMKECIAQVGTATYKATSVYSGGSGKHSLVKTENGLDTVITDNVNITVQKETIESLFGLTDFIMKMLLGKIKFTDLSTNDRRDLITKLSADDLSFATKVFKKSAAKTRDLQGTLKYLKERLVTETENLRRLEVVDDIESVVENLQTELSLLMREKQNTGVSPIVIGERMDEMQKRLDWLVERINTNPFKDNNTEGFKSVDEIKSVITKTEHMLDVNLSKINDLGEHHDKYASLLETFVKTDDVDVEAMSADLPKLKAHYQKLASKIKQFRFTGELELFVNEAQEFKSYFVSILQMLPDNSQQVYSRPNLEIYKQRADEQLKKVHQLTNSLSQVESDINHIESMHDTSCPKCQYTWKPGVKESDLQQYKDKRNRLIDELAVQKKLHEESLRLIHETDEYLATLVRLRRLFDSYPKAADLYQWLLVDKRFLHNPPSLTHIVDVWFKDLQTQFEMEQLQSKITWMEGVLKAAEMTATESKSHIESEIKRIESQINTLTSTNIDLRNRLKQLNTLLDQAVDTVKWQTELNEVLERQTMLWDAYVDSEREKNIDLIIRSYQTELAKNVERLNQRKSITSIIADLEKSIVDVTARHKTNKLLTDTLSPVDGLIAKQMLQFIHVFVDQINAVISNVWSVPLEVKPCATENGGLNYKFPLVSGDGAVTAPDVKDGSDGQLAIVNLAFRLVCIMYLGLNNYPLYLDEPGREFDEQHMSSLMSYVKMLMEGNEHSQLVIISHIAVSHGAFNDAEVCVLSGTNISVPARHNNHVTIQ